MSSHEMENRNDERGMITILMAIALVALIGIAAFAIDIGSALVTKAELQNSADAASLSATWRLGQIYKSLGANTNYKTYNLTSSDLSAIRTAANKFASDNTGAGASISIPDGDVLTGTFDKTGNLTSTTTGARAVKITSHRDKDANGVITTVFGRIIGTDTIGVRATSAAGLNALGKLKAGKGDVPIAISQHWFDAGSCAAGDNSIKFYPTGSQDGCAGWHTFTDSPASTSRLKKIIDSIEEGTFVSPETVANATYYNFNGGTIATAVNSFEDLFNAKKDANGEWKVNIPVYEASDCSNPNGAIKIIGFAKSTIYSVVGPKASPGAKLTISARVDCGIVDESDYGEGSADAGDFGVLVSSPDMIQ